MTKAVTMKLSETATIIFLDHEESREIQSHSNVSQKAADSFVAIMEHCSELLKVCNDKLSGLGVREGELELGITMDAKVGWGIVVGGHAAVKLKLKISPKA
jgi:hypothetical protein